jgi:hypothetical protein
MELKKALLTKCQQQRFLSISRRLKIGSSINWMIIDGQIPNARHPVSQTFGSVVKTDTIGA